MGDIKISATFDIDSKLDQAFIDNIAKLTSMGRDVHTLWNMPSSGVKLITTDVDEIAKGKKLVTALKTMNLALMRMARPNRDIAIVATARNEGPYLVEWVAHYISLGFDRIFIYTNDNTDGSDILLNIFHKENLITLIKNEVSSSVSPQLKAYEHSIHLLKELREFEWVAYFDIDEFLILDDKYNHSIYEYMLDMRRHMIGSKPGAIFIHWDWYGSNGAIHYERGLVQERFKLRKDYGVVKSIVHLPSISHMDDVHIPDHDLLFINSSFKQAWTINYAVDPIDYGGARLNHYFQRSFQEFMLKKQRGSGLALEDYNPREVNIFFEWEPVLGKNGDILGTPEKSISRVKSEMRKIRAIPGVVEAEEWAIERHMALSQEIFGGSPDAAHSAAHQALITSILTERQQSDTMCDNVVQAVDMPITTEIKKNQSDLHPNFDKIDIGDGYRSGQPAQ